jgi:hypothetical protein
MNKHCKCSHFFQVVKWHCPRFWLAELCELRVHVSKGKERLHNPYLLRSNVISPNILQVAVNPFQQVTSTATGQVQQPLLPACESLQQKTLDSVMKLFHGGSVPLFSLFLRLHSFHLWLNLLDQLSTWNPLQNQPVQVNHKDVSKGIPARGLQSCWRADCTMQCFWHSHPRPCLNWMNNFTASITMEISDSTIRLTVGVFEAMYRYKCCNSVHICMRSARVQGIRTRA